MFSTPETSVHVLDKTVKSVRESTGKSGKVYTRTVHSRPCSNLH